MKNHTKIQQLLAFYNELPAAERQQVDAHLKHCPACTATLAAYAQQDSDLQQMIAHKIAHATLHNLTKAPIEQPSQASAKQQSANRRTRSGFGAEWLPKRSVQLAGVGLALALMLLVMSSLMRNPILPVLVSAATPTTSTLLTPENSQMNASTPVAQNMPVHTPVADNLATVRFAVYAWDMEHYERLVVEFEKANPDIQVELLSINELGGIDPSGSDWPEGWQQRVFAAADVVDFPIGPFDHSELARDLMPFIANDPDAHLEDFYPIALKWYQWEEKLWALPLFVGFQLIYYQKDAYDEVGLLYPKPGWTWDEFSANVKALTKRQGDQVMQWGYANRWGNHLELIEARSGPLVDTSRKPATTRLLDPQVVANVQWYANLVLQEKVIPYFVQSDTQETWVEDKLVQTGKIAMWSDFGGNWWWSQEFGDLGVVPFPVDAANPMSTPGGGSEAISMSAWAQAPDAAWRWMRFLSQRSAPRHESSEVQNLSARRSLAARSGFWNKLDPELAAALRFAIDHSFATIYAPGSDAIYAAVDAVLIGKQPVEQALAEAQAKATTAIQTDGITPTVKASTTITAVAVTEQTAPGGVLINYFPLGGKHGPPTELAAQFHELHPKITVRFTQVYSDFDLADIATSNDCFEWYASGWDQASYRPHLLPLDRFLAADPSIPLADFLPNLAVLFQQDQQQWALPAQVQPTVIEYNKDLFDAAGLAYPTPEWTMDNFLTLAISLTHGSGAQKQYGFVPASYEGEIMRLMVERLGARWLDTDVNPPRLLLNAPTTVAALQRYAELSLRSSAKPILATNMDELLASSQSFNARNRLIKRDHAAMWSGVIGGDIPVDPLANTGIVPLPARADGVQLGGPAMVTGYFIAAHPAAHTSQPQACWQWITFLSSQPTASDGIPARRSTLTSLAYHQLVGEEKAAIYLAATAAEPSHTLSVIGQQEWLQAYTAWFDRAYTQVVKGEANAADALNQAQDLADRYRSCVIERNAANDPPAWRACLRDIDPTLPSALLDSQ